MPSERIPFRRKNDSKQTCLLKWAAWEWLYRDAGCRAIGFEVRLEGPGGRIADVVGLGPGNRVYVVEVKASRADRARDDHDERDRDRLEARGSARAEAVELTAGILESAARLARAPARPGTAAAGRWQDDPAYRQAGADHARSLKKLEAHEHKVEVFSTKFRDPAYLRTAHCHYIMAPAGVVRRDELPPYWGLLDGTPRALVEAPVKQVRDATSHILRAIAKANTTAIMAEYGVTRAGQGPGGVLFPGHG